MHVEQLARQPAVIGRASCSRFIPTAEFKRGLGPIFRGFRGRSRGHIVGLDDPYFLAAFRQFLGRVGILGSRDPFRRLGRRIGNGAGVGATGIAALGAMHASPELLEAARLVFTASVAPTVDGGSRLVCGLGARIATVVAFVEKALQMMLGFISTAGITSGVRGGGLGARRGSGRSALAARV